MVTVVGGDSAPELKFFAVTLLNSKHFSLTVHDLSVFFRSEADMATMEIAFQNSGIFSGIQCSRKG